VSAESLPRDLVCSQCGSSRYVEPERSARIISTALREEQVAAFLRAAGSVRMMAERRETVGLNARCDGGGNCSAG
jgi:hypothetical protein